VRASAYEFAARADARVESLSGADYRSHDGAAKCLLEEVLPLSRLGLYLKEPGLQVEVEAYENNGPSDGRVSITGYRAEVIDVQIVCDYSYEESLRAELLNRDGVAPGSGPIHRERRSGAIVATTMAEGIDEQFQRTAQDLIRLLRQKSLRRTGRQALLIAFDAMTLQRGYGWRPLYAALTREGGLSGSGFDTVYLFNGATSEIQRAV